MCVMWWEVCDGSPFPLTHFKQVCPKNPLWCHKRVLIAPRGSWPSLWESLHQSPFEHVESPASFQFYGKAFFLLYFFQIAVDWNPQMYWFQDSWRVSFLWIRRRSTEVLDENEASENEQHRTWKLNCDGMQLLMPVTPHNLGVQLDTSFKKYMSTLKDYNK